MTGVYGVIHDLVTKDVSRYSNFWSSIKSNWKQFLVFYLLIGILFSLVVINFAAYLYLDISPFLILLSLTISIVLLVLLMFIKPFVLFQICLFNNSLIQIIRNSIGFIGKRFHFNLLMFLINIFDYLLVIFLPGNFRVFALVILASFWLMFSSLTNYIICIDTLEKKLPSEQTKDFYHKGLEE